MRTLDTEKEIERIRAKQILNLELTSRENAILTLFGVGDDDIKRITRITR